MNILKKKFTHIAYLFVRSRIPKNVVRSMSKKSSFRLSFQEQHGKRVQTILKYERQHLYHIYWQIRRQYSCKRSLLVIWKMLRLFFNTLSATDKYSLFSRDNLTQPIQMQLSQKQKAFSGFFFSISKSVLNFKHLSKKKWPS